MNNMETILMCRWRNPLQVPTLAAGLAILATARRCSCWLDVMLEARYGVWNGSVTIGDWKG
jgi:hypothetical protein